MRRGEETWVEAIKRGKMKTRRKMVADAAWRRKEGETAKIPSQDERRANTVSLYDRWPLQDCSCAVSAQPSSLFHMFPLRLRSH
jgi:hypothetical protein